MATEDWSKPPWQPRRGPCDRCPSGSPPVPVHPGLRQQQPRPAALMQRLHRGEPDDGPPGPEDGIVAGPVPGERFEDTMAEAPVVRRDYAACRADSGGAAGAGLGARGGLSWQLTEN